MNEIDLIINQFILEGGKLYTLPELYHQLEEKIHSGSASMDEISEILSTDAALNAKLLKIANSALYGFRAEVTTLNRALNLIGLNDVKNLILMDSIASQFNGSDNCTNVKMEDFWRRSVYLALIAKRLSKKLKHQEPDRLFVSAIMSRLGQLVCCSTRPEEVTLILNEHLDPKTQAVTEFELEKNHLGFTYNEVSAKLLERWKVPDKIIHILRYLHKPLEIPAKDKALQLIDSSILNVATIYSGILEFDEMSENTEENNILLTDDVQSCINKVDPVINQNLTINKTTVEDILFEIEMDAIEILSIIFPNSGLIY
jgi:HD-like signal output (HDOD) protein